MGKRGKRQKGNSMRCHFYIFGHLLDQINKYIYIYRHFIQRKKQLGPLDYCCLVIRIFIFIFEGTKTGMTDEDNSSQYVLPINSCLYDYAELDSPPVMLGAGACTSLSAL